MTDRNISEFYIHLCNNYGMSNVDFIRADKNINITPTCNKSDILTHEFQVERTTINRQRYHISVIMSTMDYWIEMALFFNGYTLIDFLNPSIQVNIPKILK